MTSGDHAEEPLEQLPPLAERMPAYLKVFALGLGIGFVVGLIWGSISGLSHVEAVAYSWMIYGIVLLLVGGASGGGYSNLSLGAAGSLFGGRHRHPDEVADDADARRGHRVRQDPMERLRKGLRPQANPTAFWQVIGGIAYLVVGVAFFELLS